MGVAAGVRNGSSWKRARIVPTKKYYADPRKFVNGSYDQDDLKRKEIKGAGERSRNGPSYPISALILEEGRDGGCSLAGVAV